MIRNVALACASLLVCWLALEAAVRWRPAESDGFGHTRSARRWFAAHWHPVNALGYRDAEPAPGGSPDPRRLFVAGDSFVAGHGIERVEDRFADRLGAALAARDERWALSVVARNGWSTREP